MAVPSLANAWGADVSPLLVWGLRSDLPSVPDVEHNSASGGGVPPCRAVVYHAHRKTDGHGSIHQRHKQLLVSLLAVCSASICCICSSSLPPSVRSCMCLVRYYLLLFAFLVYPFVSVVSVVRTPTLS